MTLTSKSFVARVVLGAVALAGVAAAVPASAHPYEGRGWDGHDWRHDSGWVSREYGPGYVEGYRPVEVVTPGYYDGYRPDWRPVHYEGRGYGPVVYVHGHGRRW